jgi:hypothetical protein
MSEVDSKLSNILDTAEYIPAVKENHPVTVHHTVERDPDADYSRSNYYNLIEKGNEALEGILEVAKESQHPRAYEVAANMIKNLSDVTEKLMILQKQQKELKKDDPAAAAPTSQNINVERAVFVGSTADLLKKLRDESSQ